MPAEVISLYHRPPKKADIDPRFQSIGDRLVLAGFELTELVISRDFGYLQLRFGNREEASLFFRFALAGEWEARLLVSKYDSHCRLCGKLTTGDQIYWVPSGRPEPIRKYRRKAVNPAAKSRELWTEQSWVCHVACLPVAAAWSVQGCCVRVRAQDLTWVEHRLSELPAGATRIGADDSDYPILSDPSRRRPAPTCLQCGEPIIGRRTDARYCCRKHQLMARQRATSALARPSDE